MIAPGRTLASTCEAICSAGGRRQSCGSMDQSTIDLPSSAAVRTARSFVAAYGGRRHSIGSTRVPATAWRASSVLVTCVMMSSRAALLSQMWSKVWFSASCPASTMRSMICGYLVTLRPNTKNVAVTS